MDDILHQSRKAGDKSTTKIGATDIETPIFFDDFNNEEFENHCIAYIDYYEDEISEFTNRIYFINEDPKVRKKYARILFSLLHVGFSIYLPARREK